MKIGPSRHQKKHLQRKLEILQEAVAQPEVRACIRCTEVCSCSRQSSTCTCDCSSDCQHAAARMSTDPSAPIEPGAVKLSYELNATGLTETCWSCEGHADSLAQLARRPRIWFYSAAEVGAQLISEEVEGLTTRKQLSHEWHVSVLGLGGSPDGTIFSLEPLVSLDPNAGPPRVDAKPGALLTELRRDMNVIATAVQHRVPAMAKSQLIKLQRELDRLR